MLFELTRIKDILKCIGLAPAFAIGEGKKVGTSFIEIDLAFGQIQTTLWGEEADCYFKAPKTPIAAKKKLRPRKKWERKNEVSHFSDF